MPPPGVNLPPLPLNTMRTVAACVILCPEPEPWCTLESVAETVNFWQQHLLTAGVAAATAKLGGDELAAVQAIRRHVHLYQTLCHVAVAGDTPKTDIPQLVTAGARPSKCQVSSCPAVAQPALNQEGLDALLAMAEPRFFIKPSCY